MLKPPSRKINNCKPPKNYLSKPSPSEKEMSSDEFKAIWNIIKNWDIKTENDYGYSSGNGSHVKLLLDALYPVIRNSKIDTILN
jgi:hypothetical protein